MISLLKQYCCEAKVATNYQPETFVMGSRFLVIVLNGLSDNQCLLRDRRQHLYTGASNAGTGISCPGEKFTGRMKVGFLSI